MHRKVLIIVIVAVLVAGAVGSSSSPRTVRASDLLQDTPRLDGINIYFTESGLEASRFDRSEIGLSRLAGLLRSLGASLYTLEWRTTFPTDADLIIIAGPTRDLSADQTARLWSYVNNNGRVLLLADPPMGRSRALSERSGLNSLMWDDMGVQARDNVILTESETVDTPILDFISTDFAANHPVTANVEDGLHFFGARSIEFDSSVELYTVTALAFAPDEFYGETDYGLFEDSGILEYNIGQDMTRGPLAVAASFENPATGTRIVVIGDREFATNGGGLQTSPPYSPSFLYPSNTRFVLDAVTWLLDMDPVSMEFATPAATGTPTTTPSPTPTFTPTPEQTPTPTPTS